MPDVTAADSDIATPELMKAISAAFNSRDVEPKDRGHRSDTDRNRFLHVRSALANRLNRIGEIQNASRNQSRIFTQTVPSNKIRNRHSLSHRRMKSCNRSRQHGWLRISSEL